MADLYSCQMLGTVKEKSFGLLSLVPKDADGVPITDFEEHIVRDAEGHEVKAWVALADYLFAFGGADGTGEIPAEYTLASERIVTGEAQSIGEHFTHAGRIMYLLMGVIAALAVLIVLIALLVRHIVRRIRRKKAERRTA